MNYLSLYEFLELLMMKRVIDLKLINLIKYDDRFKISSLIEWCIEKNIVEISRTEIKLLNPVEFLVLLPLHGIAPSRFSTYIEWNEFEEYVTRVFEEFGWDVYLGYRHYRIERFQIDIIALNNSLNLSLFVECKHWKKVSHLSKELEEIIDNHIKRIEKYLRNCEWVCTRLNKLRYIKHILPVIIVLHEVPVKVFEEVPIVSVHNLRDFIANVDHYIDSLQLKTYLNRCYTK